MVNALTGRVIDSSPNIGGAIGQGLQNAGRLQQFDIVRQKLAERRQANQRAADLQRMLGSATTREERMNALMAYDPKIAIDYQNSNLKVDEFGAESERNALQSQRMGTFFRNAGLDPAQESFAAAFPDEFAKAYGKNAFGTEPNYQLKQAPDGSWHAIDVNNPQGGAVNTGFVGRTPATQNMSLELDENGGLRFKQGDVDLTQTPDGSVFAAPDRTTAKESLQAVRDLDMEMMNLALAAKDFEDTQLGLSGAWTGSLAGPLDWMGVLDNEAVSAFGGMITPGEGGLKDKRERKTRFTKSMRQFFNEYRRRITGAAAAAQELEQLMLSIVNAEQSEVEFRASFNQYIDKLRFGRQIHEELLKNGLDVSDEGYEGQFQRLWDQGILEETPDYLSIFQDFARYTADPTSTDRVREKDGVLYWKGENGDIFQINVNDSR